MKRIQPVPSRGSEQDRRKPTRSRIGRWSLLVAASVGSLCWASLAAAKPEYPGKMQQAFTMPCTPSCMLCHTDPNGGPNWNKWILARFTMPGSADPAKALAEFLAAPGAVKDFDGDNIDDDVEIRAGTDPGVYSGLSVCIAEYGCGAHLAKSPPRDLRGPFALLLAGAAAIGLLRRKPVSPRGPRGPI